MLILLPLETLFSFIRTDKVTVTIAKVFNRSRATWAMPLDISKPIEKVWHGNLFHKSNYYAVSGHVFSLVSISLW